MLRSRKSSKDPQNNRRRVTRHFLSPHDKEIIDELLKENLDALQIAQKLNHQPRQIKDYINRLNKNQVNKFTIEDDEKLIMLYNKNIKKESKLVKYFPDKSSWMIRNRIKLLKRRNQLDPTPIQPVIKSSEVETNPKIKPLSIPPLIIPQPTPPTEHFKPFGLEIIPPLNPNNSYNPYTNTIPMKFPSLEPIRLDLIHLF
ncbi:hypothetical protein TVAG_449880 [Trichomonas vaginalis G3]|uniref:Uncharacterized protein n=1 Tax=Trichomonas vaginalis (strain ATCC PRA-98 / G3) TaxID=412133 RepID=A2F4D2_TRIV3|nr:homeodomain-like family [Trichomonas vaginalis G3]EAY00252.1 hypothetical protein TVAG_449880 [Trichomonas vaginalis G3]KAI5536807.1 homeodomain-like family [Trichomonas vaginalis G3]|eukprot:XP_001313181.1 hypothetical protein [Trichomonas vaginalis G3]